MRWLVWLAASGCSLYVRDPAPSDAPVDPRVEVALVPAVANRDLDVLVLIDDSPATLDMQNDFKANFPPLVAELSSLPGGLPNLHLGVVTSDLGTSAADDAMPGPAIGSGQGACSGTGKNGVLQTYSAPLTGKFLSDVASADGSRTVNYTGTLADVFAAMASAGSNGCGFEQHLEATKRALSDSTANAGFLRPDATLAVIVLGDEDDCSLAHASLIGGDVATLGPLQSFRCTHFGITCDEGGATPDEMNQPGPKSGCHSNDSRQFLTDLPSYRAFFDQLKPDPRDVLFAAIVGDPSPVSVELRAPPGGGTGISALAHSCEYVDASNSTEVADPAVRIAQLAGTFERNVVATVCRQDLSGAEIAIGRQIRNLVGDSCLPRDIAMPADCEAFDVVGNVPVPVPACSGAQPSDCFQLVPDPAECSDGQHLRLDMIRTHAPPPRAMTQLRCKV